ncbi:MAG TPA: glycoside hydrolase, partial [Cellulomonas sp.]
SQPFEGWGTSLVWFANATGDYPAELRQQLYDLLFTADGLDLNIARYNIGGGNASDVADYLRPGGAVEGWWKADPTGEHYGATTDYADRAQILAAWDASDDADYDLDADQTQRWWVQALADHDQITHWETFANSAPYFMTESGYVSGGTNGSAEQLKPAAVDDFATYLTRVTEELEDAHGIEVATIDPLNEPNTSYWSTQLTGGVPTGGRQEGMHVGPARQADLIDALAARLADPSTTTDAVVSAMDETNPGTFATNWNAYDQQTRDAIAQLNVHTYGTSGRLAVRDIAKAADKPLWMSEVEGSWVNGWDPASIVNGLGMAAHIQDDLRELEPQAWVFWQPVEDLYNMESTGEDLNWGSVFLDFDCQYYTEGGQQVFKSARRVADAGGDSTQVPECSIVTNSKFDTTRNFTNFIRPGDQVVATNSTAATAAVSADGTATTVVYTNSTSRDVSLTVDLSKYGQIADGATATPYVTTQSPAQSPGLNAVVPGTPVAVDAAARTATVTLPAQSVSSIVIDGVSGIAADAALLQDGQTYQLVGVQSGKTLTASDGATATTITTPAATAETTAGQLWTVHEVTTGTRQSTKRYVLVDTGGRVLGATPAGTDRRATTVEAASADPATRWLVSTADGSTVNLVNEALGSALDVGGQSSAENAPVGVYGSNGGANQRWTPRSVVATGTRPVTLVTVAGVPADLPGMIVATYPWGDGSPVAVTWEPVPAETWDSPGQVVVHGAATDIYGTTLTATATVDVGGFTVTDPVSVTTFAGASLASVRAAAPSTVPARVGASATAFDAAVVWDWSGLSDDSFDDLGVVTVPGSATSNDPDASALPATLSVVVTARTTSNIATLTGTTAAATFTESASYSVDRTRNGDRADKGWSNWRSGTKNTSDTLTYTFADEATLDAAAVYFYKDGASATWAQSLSVQYLDGSGTWQPVPGYESAVAVESPPDGSAPVVTVDLADVAAHALRFVLDAQPNTHLVVSEVEIEAYGPSVPAVSGLAALRVDGAPVPGFDPAVTAYQVDVDGSAYPSVTAVPIDRDAGVEIDQPAAANGGTATVTVTAADGVTTTVTTVDVVLHTAIRSVTVAGTVKVGHEVAAAVDVDPADAEVQLAWYLDGAPVGGATGTTFVLPDSAAGRHLTVRATATADGFEPATAESSPLTVVGLSSDTGLSTLTLDGREVEGFDPATSDYTVETAGSVYPVLAATPSDGTAVVEIGQPAAGSGRGTVTVTAEDGSRRTYTVTVQRRAVVTTVGLTGAGTVGSTVTAVVATDPAEAVVTYEWSLDGETVAGEHGPSFVPSDGDLGKALRVTVGATSDGYLPAVGRTSTALRVEPAGNGGGAGGATPEPEAGVVVSLSAGEVRAGGSLRVAASGLAAGGSVVVELHSAPVRLAALTSDASGAVAATVTVPVGTTVGTHTVVVQDVTSGAVGTATLRVLAAAAEDDPLATTGFGGWMLGALAVCLVVAGAAGVDAFRRREA